MSVNVQIYLNTPAEVDLFNDFWKALENDRQVRYGPCTNPGSGLASVSNIAQAAANQKAQSL